MNGFFGFTARVAIFSVFWFALTTGEPAGWIIGVPVVLAAALLSERLQSGPRSPVSLVGASRYALFFVIESVKGGWDVAKRALLPGQRTAPLFLEYRTSLPAGWPRAIFANTVSLLPGTLTADITNDRLTLHALAQDMQPLTAVRDCERRVAAIFGEVPPAPLTPS